MIPAAASIQHQQNGSTSMFPISKPLSVSQPDLNHSLNMANNGSNKTTTTSSINISSLMEIVDGKILNHGNVFGPLPNLHKWLQSELFRVERNLENGPTVKSSPNTVVELALTKEEQNLEIVFYNGQYYFEAIRSFRVQHKCRSMFDSEFANEKPKAWFRKDLEERLSIKQAAKTWLNGKEVFFCPMCNYFSFYSNHLFLHVMLNCLKFPNANRIIQKKTEFNLIEPSSDKNNVNNNNGKRSPLNNDKSKTNNGKKIRSFDILSLLKKNEIPEKTDNELTIVDIDNNENDELVDVETLDNNEESFKLFNNNINVKEHLNHKNQFKQRNVDYGRTPDTISGDHASYQTSPMQNNQNAQEGSIRKYNSTKKHSNKNHNNNKLSQLSIINGNNNNRSAFKKLKNSSNKKLETQSKKLSLNSSSNIPSNNYDHSFISNASSFYNQLATADNNNNNSIAHNSLFTLANIYRNNQYLNELNRCLQSEPERLIMTDHSKETNKDNQPNKANSLLTQALTSSPPTIVTKQDNIFENTISASSSSSLSDSSSLSNSPAATAYIDHNNNNRKKEKGLVDDTELTSIQLLPQGALTNNPLFNLPPYFMPPTSTAANNPFLTSLYLLSPSLTALSYQSSNVCAYCNTAFRMTSDLVYHMRSHHKQTRKVDDLINKKRRDNQLRCHICNETFRERHHLTRHMTSHQ